MLKKGRHLYQRFFGAYRRHGMLNLPKAIIRRVRRGRDYLSWSRKRDKALSASRPVFIKEIGAWPVKPLISVVMPTWNTDPAWLERAVASVRNQVYEKWELCIADDASSSSETISALKALAKSDPRIRVTFRAANGHISEASNTALEMATGDYVALLDHDDELHPCALYFVAKEIVTYPDSGVIYSDEDKIDVAGHRYDPYSKTEWNPDLFLAQNMISHLGVYRTDLVRSVGGFRKGYEGSQDYDLAMRITSRLSNHQIRHIPEVLYHWRAIAGSTARCPNEKDYTSLAATRALVDVFQERGIRADVFPGWGTFNRIKYAVPKRSISVDLCIWEAYKNADMIFWESRYRELTCNLGYSIRIKLLQNLFINKQGSCLCDFFRSRTADVIVFLEVGYVPTNDEWLDELISQALRPDVGAVGGKLLDCEGRIVLSGLVLGDCRNKSDPLVTSAFYLQPDCLPGPSGRAQLTQCFTALGFSCIAIGRKGYEETGGFDLLNIHPALWSIDYCLRQWKFGKKVVWTPYAAFEHTNEIVGVDYGPNGFMAGLRECMKIVSERNGSRTSDLFQRKESYNGS